MYTSARRVCTNSTAPTSCGTFSTAPSYLHKNTSCRRGGPFPSCGGEMSSTDTLGQLPRVCTRWRSLTGWLHRGAVEKVFHTP